MTHEEAVESKAVERYLLREFSPQQEDAFAEHYFGCIKCAEDLQVTAMFVDATKNIITQKVDVPAIQSSRRWWQVQWFPARYAVAASVALLGLVLYQNIITIPRYERGAAPQALAFLSMEGAGARAGGEKTVSPPRDRPFLLLIDIPPGGPSADYVCRFAAMDGKHVIAFAVSKEMAQQTVPLLIPAGALQSGRYTMTILRRSSDGRLPDEEIARDNIIVN